MTANDAAPIDVPGPGGLSPLALACMQGNVKDAGLLLKCGADPAVECDLWDLPFSNEETTKWKAFPLLIASRQKENEGGAAILQLLLAQSSVD